MLVAFSCLAARLARLRPAAGDQPLHEGLQCGQLLGFIADRRHLADQNRAAVIDVVFEGGAGEDDAVDVGHRETGPDAAVDGPQRPARGGAVHIDPVADPRVQGRDHEGLLADGEPEVGDEAGVEDRVDRLAVVAGAVVFTDEADVAAGGGLGHGCEGISLWSC